MTNRTTTATEEQSTYHPGLFGEPSAAEERDADERSWVLRGVVAGVAGAAVVSVFFLVIDLAAGRPLWTPGALGATLFLREALLPQAAASPAIVAGYTALHSAFFVTAGLVASFAMSERTRPGPLAGLVLAAILFLALQATFLTFLALQAPSLAEAFGAGPITTANLLAAGVMSAAILR